MTSGAARDVGATVAPPEDTPARLVAAVGLASLAAVGLQVSLMRLIAVRLHPLLVFAMIGVALLGYGAAGVILAARPETSPATAPDAIGRHLVRFAATALPAFLVVNAIDVPSAWLFGTLAGLPLLLAFYAVLALPFLFAGFALSTAFAAFVRDVNRLYFADLVGAGAGSALAVAALPALGGLALLAAAGAAGAAAARLASGRRGLGVLVANLAAMLALATLHPIEVHIAPDKHGPLLARGAKPGGLATDFSQWSHFGRVDVTEPFDTLPPQFGGDLSPKLRDLRITQRMLMLDGQAPAFLYRIDRPLAEIQFFAASSQSPAYLLERNPRVLVIGVGGATDVLQALSQGASHVTAVELNAVNAHVVRDVYGAEVGHVLDDPRVTLVVAEGRNFVARDRAQYDIVQLSGVDTGAAQGAWGLGTMPESYVYTTEAFRDLLARLAPGGVLTVTRDLRLGWAHRVAALARDALAADGLDPAPRIAVLEGKVYGWATLLVRREPFTPEQVTALRAFAAQWDFPLAYDPLVRGNTLFDRVIREGATADDVIDLRPATDDWPFLFVSFRWRRLLDILRTQAAPLQNPLIFLLVNVVGLAIVALLAIGWPLWRLRSAWRDVPSKVSRAAYFASLGAGFMLIEVGLMQRFTIFLGNPVLAVATVLAALLAGSGVGSRLARTTALAGRAVVPAALAAVVAIAVVLASPLVPALCRALLGLPLAARIAVCVAVVGAAGLPMGVPFPGGLSRLAPGGRRLVAWGWGVNAMVSVVASLASYVVGMVFGYTSMFVVAGALYACALTLWPRV
ncbi:MAG TPA: hypothetical protein VMS22_24285 [Candidatus Eisenbacteria bacterium]|nr:hypothetical protein [Candidatus Eisenbacteria bacterium]